ncbi:MAG: SEC-C metal-binding domain-containing protein [Thermoplasmata archaeon]
MTKVGLNDPCPCGSGKKYKDCCMYEDTLIAKITRFSEEPQFKEDFKSASDLFFDDKNQVVFQSDFLMFMDYFVHDYKLKDSKKPLIELFYDTRINTLHPREKELLKAWQNTEIRVFEVTDIEPGKGENLKDIFDKTEVFVNDINSSHAMAKWDIAPMRIVQSYNRKHLTGAAYLMPYRLKKNIIKFGEKEFAAYKNRNPEATWHDFMKSEGYKFYRFAYKKSREEPLVITPEGDPVKVSEAVYKVKDKTKAIKILDSIVDLQIVESEGKEIHYKWLSEDIGVKETTNDKDSDDDREVLVSKINVIGKDGKNYISMGDIIIENGQLRLSCLSEKRLERGKSILKKLGDCIEFSKDLSSETSSDTDFRDDDSIDDEALDYDDSVKKFLNDHTAEEVDEMIMNNRIPADIEKKLMEKFLLEMQGMIYMQELLKKWVDDPLPSLDGKSPREAVKTSEGKEKVLEILKGMENEEAHHKKKGSKYYDVKSVREMLGL